MKDIDAYTNGRDWCIAGGWAACPQLAKDQDIWIFVDRDESLSEARAEILNDHPEITEELNGDGALAYLAETGFLTLKVGTYLNRHFMVTNARDPYVLLSGFDISTHQCAILSNGEFIRGWHWTPITQPPVIIREGGPHTAGRYDKICERYMPLWVPKMPISDGVLIPPQEQLDDD